MLTYTDVTANGLVFRCPTYNNLPDDCSVVRKAGECCPVAQCTNGYYFSSSTSPETIGNGGTIQVTNPPAGKELASHRDFLNTGS